MRLAELDPRWVGRNGEEWSMPGVRCRFGLTFRCPHCQQERIAVFFKPFIDPAKLLDIVPWVLPDAPNPNTGEIKQVHWWARTGETFDDLTLTPSIDAAAHGHWHGFISNGEVR